MSLKLDLEQVILDNLSDNGTESIELTDFQQKKAKQMATGMSDAIIKWVQAQTFTITDMKAMVEIEKLSTAGPSSADILPQVTYISPSGPAPLIGGQKGIKVPALNLKKIGGQGIRTDSLGYAYIGSNTPNGETNETKTKVKLMKVVDK